MKNRKLSDTLHACIGQCMIYLVFFMTFYDSFSDTKLLELRPPSSTIKISTV